MTGFDNQLTNRPTYFVHHEITDLADRFVAFLDMVTVHGLRALQMRIGTFGLRATCSGSFDRERFCWQFQNRKSARAPQPTTLPVSPASCD